jgi:hypothetical protein
MLAEHEHEGRQQDQHRERVEQALEDDRRKGASRGHPLRAVLPSAGLTRQEIRANDLARARRQHAARREADGRRPERVGKTGVTERLQQILPAERSNREIDHHRQQRQRQPFGTGPDDFCANAPEIDVVEKQRDQSDRDGQDDDGANVRSHAAQGPSYYSAPSTAARSRRHYMLLLSDREAPCKIHTFSSSQDRSCRSPHRFFKRR